jgi:hypothetical protein
MRQELLGAIYHVANGFLSVDGNLYYTIEQALGQQAAGNPVAGKRQRLGRDLAQAPWQRVYDIIILLWPEFANVFPLQDEYRNAVNTILAAYGVAWDLGNDGMLHRVLPTMATAQVSAAFADLSAFAGALPLLTSAQQAYDDHPRRPRDACANVFDAMESVAKTKLNMPNATFGAVLAAVRQNNLLNADTIDALEKVNPMRNHHFGHGMVTPFVLQPHEVDFVYLTCVGGALLFARMP